MHTEHTQHTEVHISCALGHDKTLYIFVSITNITQATNNILSNNIHCESTTVLGMSTGGAHQVHH